MIFKKPQNSIPNIWVSQERMIHLYKLVAAICGGLAGVLFIFMLVFAFRDPIVVVKGTTAQEFYPSKRSKIQIEKLDVVAFTNQFLTALYVWPEFNTDSLAKSIAPFSESGLIPKVIEGNIQKYGKELKGKKLSQAITFVDVDVLPDRVICRFDRILKIEGIPLVIPTEVTLSMIQGSSTRANPMGIYVAGITEHDGAK